MQQRIMQGTLLRRYFSTAAKSGDGVDKPFCIKRGHAPSPSAGARLTVNMVHDVATGKYARNAGFGRLPFEPTAHFYIAAGHIEMPLENAGIGLVADCDENAVQFDILRAAAANAAKPPDQIHQLLPARRIRA